MIKPGYRTSEFWFTLVSFIFSGLYLTGIINDHSNKEELISIVSHAVESCILIGGQFVILYKYINSRRVVKSKVVPIDNTESSVMPTPVLSPNIENKTEVVNPQPKTKTKSKSKSSKKSTKKSKRK